MAKVYFPDTKITGFQPDTDNDCQYFAVDYTLDMYSTLLDIWQERGNYEFPCSVKFDGVHYPATVGYSASDGSAWIGNSKFEGFCLPFHLISYHYGDTVFMCVITTIEGETHTIGIYDEAEPYDTGKLVIVPNQNYEFTKKGNGECEMPSEGNTVFELFNSLCKNNPQASLFIEWDGKVYCGEPISHYIDPEYNDYYIEEAEFRFWAYEDEANIVTNVAGEHKVSMYVNLGEQPSETAEPISYIEFLCSPNYPYLPKNIWGWKLAQKNGGE